jgi:general secretion pathway protein D
VEATEEIRYATDYEPATASFTPNVSAKETVQLDPKVDLTLFSPAPTAFDTRNTGITMEVEPIIAADGLTIDLNLVPQHTRLKRFNKVAIGNASGTKVIVEQPEFDVMKVTTGLTVRNGQRVLVSVFNVTEPADHLEFFILKVEAKKTRE